MQVLLVTKSDDNESVPLVAGALRARGADPVRLDTDRFPTEVKLALTCSRDAEATHLIIDGRTIDLADVGSVWWRRLNVAGRLPPSVPAPLRAPSVLESQASLYGALQSHRGRFIDRPTTIRAAEVKARQMQEARKLGLDVPRTLTTNDADAVRAFAKDIPQGLIVKMLSSFAVHEDGLEKVVFTNEVSASDLGDLSGLHLCPMTFQEKLEKQVELRATVVGNRVFVAAVDSQASERARLDWRRDGRALVKSWKPVELPKDVEAKLVALVAGFGLTYSAADFILTPDGRCVFLESNPAGEWFWLQLYAGLPIADALADALVS